MSERLSRVRGESGLSLVEMMAALLVFAVMTIGIAPLLATSLRGSNTARLYTVGKNITQESMERIRGLPYFISYGTQARKVDVLDLYFPCSTSTTCGPTGTNFDGATNTFHTTCDSTTASNLACPKDIPAEYAVEVTARFVAPGASDAEGRETYAVAAPLAGYRWDLSPSDIPASRMIEVVVTTTWQLFGEPRRFSLNSLVSDRKVAEERVRGTGRVAYAIQVLAGYRNSLGQESRLTAITGAAESRIETRLLSQSDQSAESGRLSLVKEATATGPAADLVTPQSGASAFLHAPPDNTFAGNTDTNVHTITHPELLTAIAALGESTTSNLSATTANQLPGAGGTSRITGRFWVNNQADLGQSATLKLDVSEARELVRAVSGVTSTTSGITTATTSGDRKVELTATTSIPDFRMFPVTFIPGGETVRTLIQLKNFSASVGCKSTASASATANATYTGTLSLWQESDQSIKGENQTKGGFVTFGLDTPAGRAALNAYGPTGTNPIVYEEPDLLNSDIGNELDIYMFATPGQNRLVHQHGLITHNHPAFFTSWKVIEDTTPPPSSGGGRVTSALLPDILQINSTPLKPEWPQTAVNVSIGNLSCEAIDRR